VSYIRAQKTQDLGGCFRDKLPPRHHQMKVTNQNTVALNFSRKESEEKFKWFSDQWDENFIVVLPILNALSSVLTNYFSEGVASLGQIRVFLVFLFAAYFLTTKFPHKNTLAKAVLIYLGFMLYLTLISTNFGTSFNVYLKFAVSYLFLFFGIYYIKNPEMMKRVSVSILVMLGIFILNFIISNIFGLGARSYKGVENQLNFGASGVNLAKQITPILLMMPIILKFFIKSLNQKIIYALIFGGILFVLFAFKRTPLVSLFLGYLIIGLIIPNKAKTIKYFFVLLFAAVALSPIYLNQVLDNFQAREQAIDLSDEENLEKQARYQEFNFVLDSWGNGDLKHKLIGSDIFAAHEYFNLGRMLHTDYMTLLSGSGIIGLFGFLFIYAFIVVYLWRKHLRYKNAFFAYSFAIGTAIIVNFLFMGVSGIAQAVEPRATVFLFLGMLIGFKPEYFNTIQNDSTAR
jgi:hypothetical protein